MVWLKKIWRVIIRPYTKLKEYIAMRKRLKELRKKDPFTYK